MAIAVELTYPGATVEEYKKILSDAGITAGGSHPDPECLFHWATEVAGGFRVTDVWTSREKWDAFEATGTAWSVGHTDEGVLRGRELPDVVAARTGRRPDGADGLRSPIHQV